MNADNPMSMATNTLQQWMIDSSTVGQAALTLTVFALFVVIMVTTPAAVRGSSR